MASYDLKTISPCLLLPNAEHIYMCIYMNAPTPGAMTVRDAPHYTYLNQSHMTDLLRTAHYSEMISKFGLLTRPDTPAKRH